MSYQKCPICEGSGLTSNFHGYYSTCDTCKGTKIIHTETGKPPGHTITVTDAISTAVSTGNFNNYTEGT